MGYSATVLLTALASAVFLTVLVRWSARRRIKREALEVQARARRELGVTRVRHNLYELEPLVSCYDAVHGNLLPAKLFHITPIDETTFELRSDYERPFRVVVMNGQMHSHRQIVIPPQEEKP